MDDQNRKHYDLPNLCQDCLSLVACKTLDVREVINALGDAGRGFCSRLNYNIIPRDIAQRIKGAKDDSEALGLIHRALQNSLVPEKLDIVIQLLSFKEMGKKIQAEKIKKYYYEQIRQHKRCEKCHVIGDPNASPSLVAQPGTSQEQCQVSEVRITADQKPLPYINTIADISTQEYSNGDKLNLLSYKVYTLIPIGESLAGKTSLIRTLVLKKSHLTSNDDRTVVVELLRWIPVENQDQMVLIYDIGGHHSYKNTAQCFQVNSPSTVRLLCHDVTSDKFGDAIHWLKTTQTIAPDSKIILCLTQMDKLDNDSKSRDEKVKTCLNQFSKLINEEIKVTKRLQEHTEENSKNWDLYEKHLKSYRLLEDQIKTNPIRVSCTPGNQDSVTILRDYLLKLIDGEDTILLGDIDKELFLHIGQLGLKEAMIVQDDGISEGHQLLPSDEDKSLTPNEENSLTHDEGKSITPNEGKSLTLDEESKDIEEQHFQKKQDIKPRDSKHLKQQYVTLDEALPVFEKIHQENKMLLTDPEKEIKRSLTNLSNKGLLRYFLGDEDLEKIIFNDISTLVNILRSVYHHNVSLYMNFSLLDAKLRKSLYENERGRYVEDIAQLQQHGILSTNLLRVLLHSRRCLIAPHIVVKLLAKLGIAYAFETQSNDNLRTFVPYFIENEHPSDEVQREQNDVFKCDENRLGLLTVLRGTPSLSLSFFHNFLVKVYKKYCGRLSTQTMNKTWNRRMWISLGNSNAKFMIDYNIKEEIECAVQADISVQGHHIIWDCIKFFHGVAKDTRTSMFPGLILDYILRCTHCRLFARKDHSVQVAKCEWYIEKQLLSNAVETYKCEKNTDIPAALLAPLPTDEHMSTEFMDALRKYLKAMTPDSSSQTRPTKCLLKIADETLELSEVIDHLWKVNKAFWNHLNIITIDTREEIVNAKNSSYALGLIRTTLKNSPVPDKLDIVIRVLREMEPRRAELIENFYHEKIRAHKCAECGTKEKTLSVSN